MRIQLGCNYSRPLLDLLSRGAVRVDWIKLSHPDTLEQDLPIARAVRPVLLHTIGRAGRRPEAWDAYPWEKLNDQLAAAGSPHIALHLDLRQPDWDEPLDPCLQDPGQARAILRRLADGIRAVQAHVRVPVLVENLPYHGAGGVPRIAVQPEGFWQLVDGTGVGLLLDTAHLRASADNLGVDARAYAQALPLHTVREVHVNGPRVVDGRLRDRHYTLQPEDYALIAWVLEHTRPEILTLEYGGVGPLFETPKRNDPQALEEQLLRLEDMLARHNA